MDFWIAQLKLFLINIATPHEFGLPCEKNALPPRLIRHLDSAIYGITHYLPVQVFNCGNQLRYPLDKDL